MNLHKEHKKQLSSTNAQILWIGDSITEQWNSAGRSSWDTLSQTYMMLNLGIGGDKIENVLWRISDHDWSTVSPKVIVLMLGTNNLGFNSSDEIFTGIAETAEKIHDAMPSAKIVLLSIFPRGDNTEDALRKEIKVINQRLSTMNFPSYVHFHELWDILLETDGTIGTSFLADKLHLSAEGYEKWEREIRPILESLVK